jgi:hypothetical protein
MMSINLSYPTLNLIANYFGASQTLMSQISTHIGTQYENGQFTKGAKAAFSSLPNSINNGTTISGIDLPVMLSDNVDAPKKTVLILGQDPLRDPHDLMLPSGYNAATEVVFGLPYAVQFGKKYKGVKLYHLMFEDIIRASKSVYLTDAYKFWIKGGRKTKSVKQLAVQLLQNEINTVKPDSILLWGKSANAMFTKFHLRTNANIVSMPHPSGAANGEWKKVLSGAYSAGSKATFDNKIKYFIGNILPQL